MSEDLPAPRKKSGAGEERLIKAIWDHPMTNPDAGPEVAEVDGEVLEALEARPVTKISLRYYENAMVEEMPLSLDIELEYRLTQDEIGHLASVLLMALPKKPGLPS